MPEPIVDSGVRVIDVAPPKIADPAPAEAPATTPVVGGEQAAPAPAAEPAAAAPAEPQIDAEKRRRFVEAAQRRAQERRERDEALAKARAADDVLSAKQLIEQGKYLEAARKLGIPYDKLTDQILGEGREPTVEEQVAQLKAEREAEKKAAEEQRQAQLAEAQRRVAAQAIANTKVFVERNAEAYPLLAADDGAELVYETADAYVKKHGLHEPIDVVMHKAAKAAEASLQERAERLEKALAKKRPAAQPGNAQQPDTAAAAPTARGSRTLTNRVASEAPAALRVDDLPLDPDLRTKALAERFALARN